MKNSRILRALFSVLVLSFVLCLSTHAQPVLVTNAPAAGTFYLLSVNPSLPFPFDPYFGAMPVYSYDGVFFVDDSQLGDLSLQQGGGMTMNSLGPPGIGDTNNPPSPPVTNICSGPTNFSVVYQYSANGLALGIALTTNPLVALSILTSTNENYDVFGTTNMASLSPSVLSKTNWVWLIRAAGSATNFSWGETNWCERYFQLGKTNDSDGDWLSDAYESLVSHTRTNKWDTDDDELSDWWELHNGLNPLLNESTQTGSRINYIYNGAGRITQVSGKRTESVTVDAEGNITDSH
jgi:hypothetical protein